MLEELFFNTTQRLVAAEQENECLNREKADTQDALWTHIVWLIAQNEEMQDVDENKQEELKGLREEIENLTAELLKKTVETKETQTKHDLMQAESIAEMGQLHTQLANLRNKHDAKKLEINRQGLKITVMEEAKTLAETAHKKEIKSLRNKAVTWRRQGSFFDGLIGFSNEHIFSN